MAPLMEWQATPGDRDRCIGSGTGNVIGDGYTDFELIAGRDEGWDTGGDDKGSANDRLRVG